MASAASIDRTRWMILHPPYNRDCSLKARSRLDRIDQGTHFRFGLLSSCHGFFYSPQRSLSIIIVNLRSKAKNTELAPYIGIGAGGIDFLKIGILVCERYDLIKDLKTASGGLIIGSEYGNGNWNLNISIRAL